MEGLTTEQPPGSPRQAAGETMLEQGEPRILRAGGGEPAGGREERRDPALVKIEQRHQETDHAAGSRLGRTPESSRRTSPRKVLKSAALASGFRWTTRSSAGSFARSFHRR